MLGQPMGPNQGMARSQARARLTLYWLGINVDIENISKKMSPLPRLTAIKLQTTPNAESNTRQTKSQLILHCTEDSSKFSNVRPICQDIIDIGKDTVSKTYQCPLGPILLYHSTRHVVV